MDINELRVQRLNEIIEKNHFTYAELEKITGVSKSSLQRYASGTTKKIPVDCLEAIAKAAKVDPRYLLAWDEEDKSREPKQELEQMSSVYMRPIFDSVSAGFGAYADSHIVGYQPVYISNPHDIDSTICIRVTGESMYPKIEDGDLIVVRRQCMVDSGRIAVVRIGDEAVVKKITIGKNSITLESTNPLYPPRIISGPDLEDVEIVGLVQNVIKAV